MLTTGKIIFAISFLLVFVIAMFWSYQKDAIANRVHFKGASKILISVVVVLIILFLFVKLRH